MQFSSHLPATNFQPLRCSTLRILEFPCRLFTAFHMPKMGNGNSRNSFLNLQLQEINLAQTIEVFCAISRYLHMPPPILSPYLNITGRKALQLTPQGAIASLISPRFLFPDARKTARPASRNFTFAVIEDKIVEVERFLGTDSELA
jgi:hypothetical protein